MKLDLFFAGVGGQGVMLVSDIFCEAAIAEGFDVSKAEIHGVAQRGGSINVFVRIGDKVLSPLFEEGTADIIIGFELLETARALPMLKSDGTIVFNDRYIPPVYFSKGSPENLKPETLIKLIHEKTSKAFEVDAQQIANKLGNPMVANFALLGAVSALDEISVQEAAFKKAITNRIGKKWLNLNLQAFKIGHDIMSMA